MVDDSGKTGSALVRLLAVAMPLLRLLASDSMTILSRLWLRFEAVELARSTTTQPPQRLTLRRPTGLWGRFYRLVRFRLIVPMMRSHHTPEFSARAALVGLGWAFTPSVGFQMPVVLGTWLIARRVFKWDFSLLQSLAWTWTTNAFTALPCYYIFFLTGQVMLGRWSDLSGYDDKGGLESASVGLGPRHVGRLVALGGNDRLVRLSTDFEFRPHLSSCARPANGKTPRAPYRVSCLAGPSGSSGRARRMSHMGRCRLRRFGWEVPTDVSRL